MLNSRRIVSLAAAVALLAAAAPAANAARGIPYTGKTSGGHKVTFKLGKGRLWEFKTGIPMTCLPIQGGGNPITGVEPWAITWLKLGVRNGKITWLHKPAFHYKEVTMNHTVTTRRARNGTISGAVRLQYSFLIPKFPIGTFSIYSCLGRMTFTARPAR